MKNMIITLLVLLLLNTTEAETLKIATFAPEGSLWMVELRKLNRELKRKTRGKVQLHYYVGGIAGEERAVAKKLELGALDGAAFAGTGLGEIMSQLRVLELPFYYESYEQWRYVFKNLSSKFEKKFEKKGYKLLGWTEAGFAYLFSGAPIRNLAEFRQAKVWFYEGDPMLEACFREIKASGVPLGLADVITSLQTGKINCVYCPAYWLLVTRWHSEVRYCTELPIANILSGLVMRKAAYNRLSKRHRKILSKLCRKYMSRSLKKVQKANKDTKKLLKERYKIQFVQPEPTMVEELKTFSRKVAESQVGTLYPAALLQKVEKLRRQVK